MAYLMTANEVTHLYLDHAAVFAFSTHTLWRVCTFYRAEGITRDRARQVNRSHT